MHSSTMMRQVVQAQPQSEVEEDGNWSTGLCECHKDMGDCKYMKLLDFHRWSPVTESWAELLLAVVLLCVRELMKCVYVICPGCFALCCLPVFTCKVTSAVGACPCLPLLDCIGCVPPASLAMRASVREQYGIKVQEKSTNVTFFTLQNDTCFLMQCSSELLAGQSHNLQTSHLDSVCGYQKSE